MAALNLAGFAQQMQRDKATRAADKTQGLGALQQALAAFGPDYGRGAEMEAKAAAGASNISAGLGGTSMPGSVSAGLTAKFKDMRLQGQAGIQQAIAQFLANFRDPTTITPETLVGVQRATPATQGGYRVGSTLYPSRPSKPAWSYPTKPHPITGTTGSFANPYR